MLKSVGIRFAVFDVGRAAFFLRMLSPSRAMRWELWMIRSRIASAMVGSPNRNGLAVDATLTHATGTAEREAALTMVDRRKEKRKRKHRRITLGADKAYDATAFVEDLREGHCYQWRGQQAWRGPQKRQSMAHHPACGLL
ncbi:hypothetical protein ACVIM8_001696 [Bradyrhizobium sp. USDA 4529]